MLRQNQSVTIIKGKSAYCQQAAERLQRILKPWNVSCSIVDAVEAANPRQLTDDEARTWIGLNYAGRGQIKPGIGNSPVMVGFSVAGSVILIGNPEDNAFIKFLVDQKYLPYKPEALAMPGQGRGYVSWQREAIGVNQESVALIAYDDTGMDEAVGTLYAMVAGQESITPLMLPHSSSIQPANSIQTLPGFKTLWSVILDDSITGLSITNKQLSVFTRAEILSELSADGRVLSEKPVHPSIYSGMQKASSYEPDVTVLARIRRVANPGQLVKIMAQNRDRTAVAYWGGSLSLFDKNMKVIATDHRSQDITALAWIGEVLIVGDANGRIAALTQ
jgi:hypothetical protein